MGRGRPREFDVDEALDRALEVFWRKGYEGASVADLTEAMGINRPSLYAAFGDKEQLFRKVIDRYAAGSAGYVGAALAEPTAFAAARALLRGAAELLTDPRHPAGCLLVQGALVCGDGAAAVREELVSRRALAESCVRERLERAAREGDLPPGLEAADLARYLVTLVRGMAVQATGGATREDLLRVAELALRLWPR